MTQNITTLTPTSQVSEFPNAFNATILALRSTFSGNSFPQSPAPVEGQQFFHTGFKRYFRRVNEEWQPEHNNTIGVRNSKTTDTYANGELVNFSDDGDLIKRTIGAIIDRPPQGIITTEDGITAAPSTFIPKVGQAAVFGLHEIVLEEDIEQDKIDRKVPIYAAYGDVNQIVYTSSTTNYVNKPIFLIGYADSYKNAANKKRILVYLDFMGHVYSVPGTGRVPSGGGTAAPPTDFAFGTLYSAGDMFYYTATGRRLLFLVLPNNTFQASDDAATWDATTWKNFVYTTDNLTAKIILLADVSAVSKMTSIDNAIVDSTLTTTITYEDNLGNTQTLVSNPTSFDIATLSLGQGVADVESAVLYQAPSTVDGSTIGPQSFATMLGIINNPAASNRDNYRVPTTLAAASQASGNYAVETIRHNGADRTCLVLTMKARLDTFSNILFYTAPDTHEFPAPNLFGAKELSTYTAANGFGYSIRNLISQSSSTHRGFIVFSDGDKKIYIYKTGAGTEYLGWVNLQRFAAVKGEGTAPQQYNANKTYNGGDTFWYGTDNRVLVFLVKSGQTFQPSVDAPAWNDSTWQNYVHREGQTSAKLILMSDASDVSKIISMTNAVSSGNLTTTLVFENVWGVRLSITSSPVAVGGGGGGGATIDDNSDVVDKVLSSQKTKQLIATAKDEAIGAGQILYAIWQSSHGDPTSATNAASRPVATFAGNASWDATNERVNVATNVGSNKSGSVYWKNESIDFRRCALTSEIVLGIAGSGNQGRSFVFILGSNTGNLNGGNQLEIAIDLDGYDQGAPSGTRQIYIYNRHARTYLGTKRLPDALTANQKLEFKAVIDVEEITIYLDGIEVWHLEGITLPAMDTPFFGVKGNAILTQVYAIAIEQLPLYLAAPRLQLPTTQGGKINQQGNLELQRRGGPNQTLILPTGTANKAINAFVSDMEWPVEIQTYNDPSAPTSPATIGMGYRIFTSGHRIDFIFPTATTKSQVDYLVIGKRFSINTPEGTIILKPTNHIATEVVSSAWHSERYAGKIEPTFTGFAGISDGNNDYQTTLYREDDREAYTNQRLATYSGIVATDISFKFQYINNNQTPLTENAIINTQGGIIQLLDYTPDGSFIHAIQGGIGEEICATASNNACLFFKIGAITNITEHDDHQSATLTGFEWITQGIIWNISIFTSPSPSPSSSYILDAISPIKRRVDKVPYIAEIIEPSDFTSPTLSNDYVSISAGGATAFTLPNSSHYQDYYAITAWTSFLEDQPSIENFRLLMSNLPATPTYGKISVIPNSSSNYIGVGHTSSGNQISFRANGIKCFIRRVVLWKL